jgi:hypothetical protein
MINLVRMLRRVAATGVAGVALLAALPDPAFADNCSGLSDCSTGVKIGLVLAGIVLAIVFWEVFAAFAAEAGAEAALEAGALDAFELEFSETAASHAATRPFMESRLLIQEIMDAAEPIADPQGALNTVRWDVPGTFNGSEGTWELVVNTVDKIIYHFNFVR